MRLVQPLSCRARAAAAVLLAQAFATAAIASASADACPGAGAGSCPYVAAHIIGQRAEGVLRFPEAVAVGPQGDVFVAESGNNRIQRFDLEGGEAIAWGTKGAGPGQFAYPRGLAANSSEVLVADDDNHRIEKFDPGGGFQAAVGSRGTGPGRFGFPY